MIKDKKYFLYTIILLLTLAIISLILTLKNGLISDDPIILFFHILLDTNFSLIQIVAPLFVMIPTIVIPHKEFHSGYISNLITRDNYFSILSKNYKRALINSTIIPLSIFSLFVICIFVAGGKIGSATNLYGWIVTVDEKYIEYIYVFLIVYFLNLLLHSIFYINIALFSIRKNYNIYVSILFSYITFLFVNVFFEVIIGSAILPKVFNIHNMADTFSLFNIWLYDNVISLSFYIIYSLLLVLLSLYVLYKWYSNKEKVLNEIN
jgi:hypothetical protein